MNLVSKLSKNPLFLLIMMYKVNKLFYLIITLDNRLPNPFLEKHNLLPNRIKRKNSDSVFSLIYLC
jgi:hypothetical protein